MFFIKKIKAYFGKVEFLKHYALGFNVKRRFFESNRSLSNRIIKAIRPAPFSMQDVYDFLDSLEIKYRIIEDHAHYKVTILVSGKQKKVYDFFIKRVSAIFKLEVIEAKF